MNEKVEAFEKKGGVETYSCGKEDFWDNFRKTNYIKNLDGDVLYEGKGSFQRVLEQAVKEKVDLSGADLRNQKFKGLQIENAKLQGASFEGSVFNVSENILRSFHSNLKDSDLRNVSFKNTRFDYWAFFENCNVEKANFTDCKKSDAYANSYEELPENLYSVKNLDKSYGIKRKDLDYWKKVQLKEEEDKTKEARDNEILNPYPSAVAKLKEKQGR